MKINLFRFVIAGLLICAVSLVLWAATPPAVGDKAPDFTLKTLDDQMVKLSDLTLSGKVVLVVLRGYPGYQCPFCERQVKDFINSASSFADANARVIMVYPGPADELKAHAKEFIDNKQWPKEFYFVIDPGYNMISSYGLRWDARHETSYASTFVLDRNAIIRYAKISHSHGDRAKAADIMDEVKRIAEK